MPEVVVEDAAPAAGLPGVFARQPKRECGQRTDRQRDERG
jgi:hypothetical protein